MLNKILYGFYQKGEDNGSLINLHLFLRRHTKKLTKAQCKSQRKIGVKNSLNVKHIE